MEYIFTLHKIQRLEKVFTPFEHETLLYLVILFLILLIAQEQSSQNFQKQSTIYTAFEIFENENLLLHSVPFM